MSGGDSGLILVSAPDTDYSADLVFVHGLDGHRSRTWKNKQGEFWPQWISQPSFLPQSRIWTYGYNAKSILGSEDDLTLHATTLLKVLVDTGVGRERSEGPTAGVATVKCKPIVFIAHSLGGIVVKMAMLLACESGKAWSYVFQNTVALVFMGTPHRGSRWANRLFLLATSVFRTFPEFLHLLRDKSTMLSTLADRFNNIWGDKPILSFRETVRVPGIGIIVSPKAAVTNCRCEQVVDVSGTNHLTICKPESTTSDLFQTFINQITSFTKIVPIIPKSIGVVAVELGAVYKKSSKFRPVALSRELRNIGRLSKSRIEWNAIEEEVEDGKWISGSYWCSFPCEANEVPSTTIFLETDPTPGQSLSWSIRAPESLYYPGTHSGTIEVEGDYPFSQPWLKFSTPIFSPIISKHGSFSSTFDLGNWRPDYTIMDLLHSVAAMIVLDPFCHSSSHRLLPGIPLDHHVLNDYIGDWSGKRDSFIRAANFFSRAYLQGDIRRAGNPPITKHEVTMSIIAVQELLEHFTGSQLLEAGPITPGSSSESNRSVGVLARAFAHAIISRFPKSNNPVASFRGVQSTEEWIAEEKRWADAISLRCNLGFIDDTDSI